MVTNAFRRPGLALVVPFLLAATACGIDETQEDPRAATAQVERSTSNYESTSDAGTDAAERTERRTAERRVVPRGTVMTLSLDESISTESHERGDQFTAHVTQSVRSRSGTVLVPEGADVQGVIQESERSTGPDDQAILAFRLESIEIDGERHPLAATVQQARPERTEGDSGAETAAKIAIGTAAGALIGQVLGKDTESTLGGAAAGAVAGTVVALVSRRGDATLRKGSRLRVQLNDPIQLDGSF